MADECKHTRKLCVSIRAQGGHSHPNVASRFVPKGFPDRTIVCPWGQIVLIEGKSEFGKVRSEQREQFEILKELGAPAWVLRFQNDPPHLIRFEDHLGEVYTDWLLWSKFFSTVRELQTCT